MMYAVIVVSDAERSIPIAYARAVRGAALAQNAATYLPIRLLQAGVIPIIFALSLLLVPQMVLSMLGALNISFASSAALWYTAFLSNPWNYGAIYFLLVVLFTYFYTAVTFEPHRVAENLQKSGAFVPGVRPGRETEDFIGRVVNRVTLPRRLLPRSHRGGALNHPRAHRHHDARARRHSASHRRPSRSRPRPQN